MFLALGCAVVVLTYGFVGGPSERADAAVTPLAETAAQGAPTPLVRTDPGINPWVERDIPPPQPKAAPKSQAVPKSQVVPSPPPPPVVSTQQASAPEPAKQPGLPKSQPEEPASTGQNGPPQVKQPAHPAKQASHYHLPPGAIMTLTVPSLGLTNAPVMNSASKSSLDRGVVHLPDTSLPWSETPERNVYLAGHRLGWPGTGSHLIFYRLGELTGGEEVTLRGPNGKTYTYRVLEKFIVGPRDNWVTGRVRGRDLLTLQTCTPIPTFQKRLIVRAERV